MCYGFFMGEVEERDGGHFWSSLSQALDFLNQWQSWILLAVDIRKVRSRMSIKEKVSCMQNFLRVMNLKPKDRRKPGERGVGIEGQASRLALT